MDAPFSDQLLTCQKRTLINALLSHMQYTWAAMAHPVQRLHRLPLSPPLCQGGGHRFQWRLPGLQPEHRH